MSEHAELARYIRDHLAIRRCPDGAGADHDMLGDAAAAIEALERERDAAVADNAAVLIQAGHEIECPDYFTDYTDEKWCEKCMEGHPGAALLAELARLRAVAEAAAPFAGCMTFIVHGECDEIHKGELCLNCKLHAALDAAESETK